MECFGSAAQFPAKAGAIPDAGTLPHALTCVATTTSATGWQLKPPGTVHLKISTGGFSLNGGTGVLMRFAPAISNDLCFCGALTSCETRKTRYVCGGASFCTRHRPRCSRRTPKCVAEIGNDIPRLLNNSGDCLFHKQFCIQL